jgi:beta-glucosidase/6-phospho-beta-glucosidase/beta-galactosidase
MFAGFFLAGFEGTTGYNVHGEWIDQVSATQHDRFVDEDYVRLSRHGIRTVREAVRWPLIDAGRGRHDFTSLKPFVAAARRHGIGLIFDLFHFGYPQDADPFSEGFPIRFAEYAYAAARFVSAETDGVCCFTPVNEPSYFSWAAGEAGLFAPHQRGRGWELKVQMIRTAIRGMDAIRAACPSARFVNVDPICRVVAPSDREDLQEEADRFNRNVVFQGWDMLSGRLLPELGGSAGHLDIVGVNYYWTNQWEIGNAGVPLRRGDPRCARLRDLIRTVHDRYETDLMIAETAHIDEMRADWVREVAHEAAAACSEGVRLQGICFYPATSMPEWHARQDWTHMGFWDLDPREGVLHRIEYKPMIRALREARQYLDGTLLFEPGPAGDNADSGDGWSGVHRQCRDGSFVA